MDDPTGPDAAASTTVMCKYADPALRLCVEFADGNYSTATDGSAYHMHADAQDVVGATRSGQNAAGTYWSSRLEIGENSMLDISPTITFESWMRVPGLAGYHNAKLLYNQAQYEIGLDSEGKVTCRVGALSAKSENAIGRDVWRHVACVYDGSSLSLWLDGAPNKCQTGSAGVFTTGTNGTRLVAGFTGYLDDLRVYARNLSGSEICSHADKAACSSVCPE